MNVRSATRRLPREIGRLLPETPSLDATKRKILERALWLFASRGYHATSMRDLAQALEMQASAIYGCFASKEQLLAELVRVGHETHLAACRRALLDAGSDPVEQLRALVRENARFHLTYPHLAVVVNDEMHGLSAEQASGGLLLRQQAAAMLFEVIERGTRMGRFDCLDAIVTGAAIGAMSLRIPYWFDAEPGRAVSAEEVASAHAELALRMLGASHRPEPTTSKPRSRRSR